jgi:Gly-Xaa carboxypeptidase
MRVAAVTVALGGLALCAAAFTQATFDSLNWSDGWCPQPEYVPPSPAMAYYDTPLFANLSLERLFGAIAHATVAYDDFGEPEPEDRADRDPRWDTFPPFHNFLRETYPLVYVVDILESN